MKRLDLDLLAIVLFVGSMIAVLHYSCAGGGIPTLARVFIAIAVIVALATGVARESQYKAKAPAGAVLTQALMLLVAVCWLFGMF